jgi:hypothetical protein
VFKKVKHAAEVIYYVSAGILGIMLFICAFFAYFVTSIDLETGIRTDGLGRTLYPNTGIWSFFSEGKEGVGFVWSVLDLLIPAAIAGVYYVVGKTFGFNLLFDDNTDR